MTDREGRVFGMREWLAAWGLRLLAGLTLLVFSELVWQGRDLGAVGAGAWAVLAGLYVLLGALTLDVLARFRVGELFGWLAAAGLYGLLQGGLVALTAFDNLPVSLVTRPLGLHTLGGGMVGLGFLYWLLAGGGWTAGRVAILAAGGLAWGVWVRWSPLLPASDFPVPSFPAAAAVTGGGLAVLWALAQLAGRAAVRPEDCRLRRWEWLLVGAGLVAAFWRAVELAGLDALDTAILGGLAGYLLMLLYLLRDGRRILFLERALPPRPAGPGALAAVAIWLAAGGLGYALPGAGPDGLPLRALTTGLALFGILWLPALSVGMGLRIFTRLFREGG